MVFGFDILSIVVMFSVSGAVFVIVHLLTNTDNRVELRLEDAARSRGALRDERTTLRRRVVTLLGGLLPDSVTQILIGNSGKRNHLQSRLIQAGLYGSGYVPIYVTAKIAFTIVPVAMAFGLGMSGVVEPELAVWGGALAGGAGMLIPSFWLDRRRDRRHVEFTKSLPDTLDLLITCLSSGLSIEAAIHRVTLELTHAHPMLAGEMSRVQHEIGLGATVDDAFRNLAERTDLNSFKTLAILCQQSRQFGSRMTDALRVHADMLRSQREQRAEERAQKAAVKILLPTLLLIFPSVFVVLAGPAAIQIWETFANPAVDTRSASEPSE